MDISIDTYETKQTELIDNKNANSWFRSRKCNEEDDVEGVIELPNSGAT